jgi:hypothetical protein
VARSAAGRPAAPSPPLAVLSALYLANFPRNYSHFFFVTGEKKKKKNVTKTKKNETILAA